MSVVDLVRSSAGLRMVDADGVEDVLRLLPPATPDELAAIEAAIPCPVPPHIRELLLLTRGFDNSPVESVDFGGLPGGIGMEEMFPHALPLAHDGFGNYWVADLGPDSSDWAPIWFLCHDPPVVAYQAASLEHFVKELLGLANPPYRSELDTVHERTVIDIWRGNPGVVPVAEARESADALLRAFARSVADGWEIIDLRGARIGDGLSWGRYGPGTRIVRHASEPVFAVEPVSRLRRLFRFGRPAG